jgi:hypothetical protein
MGSKRHVTLSIDSKLLDQIKSRTENLSKLTEELYSLWLSVYSEKLEQIKGELQQELKSKFEVDERNDSLSLMGNTRQRTGLVFHH